MRLNGHLYLVTFANGRPAARKFGDGSGGDRLASRLEPGELIVSARDEEGALKIARVIPTAGRARELVTERDAAFREGYAAALGALKAQIGSMRAFQPERPTGQYAGVTEGRLDLLDALDRWALAAAPTERPEKRTCPKCGGSAFYGEGTFNPTTGKGRVTTPPHCLTCRANEQGR